MNNNFSQEISIRNSNKTNFKNSNVAFKNAYVTPTINNYCKLFSNEKIGKFSSDIMNWYVNNINKLKPNDSKEEIQKLLNQINKGGKIAEIAQKKLYNMHLEIVIPIARKLCSKIRKSKLEDVMQEGNIGLLNAVKIYNMGKDGDFVPFAIKHIIREIAEKYNLYHLL